MDIAKNPKNGIGSRSGVYVHTYVYSYTHIYICTHTRIYIYIYLYLYIHTLFYLLVGVVSVACGATPAAAPDAPCCETRRSRPTGLLRMIPSVSLPTFMNLTSRLSLF